MAAPPLLDAPLLLSISMRPLLALCDVFHVPYPLLGLADHRAYMSHRNVNVTHCVLMRLPPFPTWPHRKRYTWPVARICLAVRATREQVNRTGSKNAARMAGYSLHRLVPNECPQGVSVHGPRVTCVQAGIVLRAAAAELSGRPWGYKATRPPSRNKFPA
jgi:hypothetical protein